MNTTTITAPAGPAAPPAGPPGEGGLGKHYRYLLWAPIAAAAVITAAMWSFVGHALMSNPLLNGKILLVMFWGVWTMHVHVQRIYAEDRAFQRGMAWLRRGVQSGEQNPAFGPEAFVNGMLSRLNKLGLGHQVYIHSAATEPEVEALGHYLDRKQELSQFLVGLMVGLGLLGTFIGLLQTLVQTSDLIATIAQSSSGKGNIEEEFGKIVGGLQGPLAGMGTAFSASMFGLVGSILLGFQLVVVRKTASDFVESVREDVLSLAEKSHVNEKAEVTERFLATLMADMLEQHRVAGAGLRDVVAAMRELAPRVETSNLLAAEVGRRIKDQEVALERTTATVGSVGQVVPAMGTLADSSRRILAHSDSMNKGVATMVSQLPVQEKVLGELREALVSVDTLAKEVRAMKASNGVLRDELRAQGALIKRMDATLWSAEKSALRDALGEEGQGQPPTAKD